ncbi:MAG: hypothetical protein ACT4NX_01500 [Deltaproteobacteria bacterium]
MIDDLDYDNPVNYKGFDLSEVEENDLADMMEKIDLIHENMATIKDLCAKLISLYDPARQRIHETIASDPDIHQRIMEESIKLYGEERGKRFVELILGRPDGDSVKLQMAKAKAFIISYERQFDDEILDPIQPSQFEETDIYKIMQRLTDGKSPMPNLTSRSG